MTLIAAGGLHSPGICLKAMALGADACYIGTPLMLAIVSDQAMQALPWEPPYSLFLETGSRTKRFSVEAAAERAGDYLSSSVEELKFGLRALGKSSIAAVGREDMIALTQEVSQLTGCRGPYGPRRQEQQPERELPAARDGLLDAPPVFREQPQERRLH